MPSFVSIASNLTNVGNVGGGEDTLYSDSIPANSIRAAGDYIEANYAVSLADNPSSRSITVYFNGTSVFTVSATPSEQTSVEVTCRLYWKSNTELRCVASSVCADANFQTAVITDISGLLLSTTAYTLVLKGGATGSPADNDLVAYIGNVIAFRSATEAISGASEPEQTTAYLTTRDGKGNVKGSVTLSFKLISGPGDSGHSYDRKAFTATSNSSTGLLQVALLRGATYTGTRGDGNAILFVTGDDSTYLLPEWLGVDA